MTLMLILKTLSAHVVLRHSIQLGMSYDLVYNLTHTSHPEEDGFPSEFGFPQAFLLKTFFSCHSHL